MKQLSKKQLKANLLKMNRKNKRMVNALHDRVNVLMKYSQYTIFATQFTFYGLWALFAGELLTFKETLYLSITPAVFFLITCVLMVWKLLVAEKRDKQVKLLAAT